MAQKTRREAEAKAKEKAKKQRHVKEKKKKKMVGVSPTTLEQSASRGYCFIGEH